MTLEDIEINIIIYRYCRRLQTLDVDPSSAKLVDLGHITQSSDVSAKLLTSQVSWRSTVAERANSDDFVDCEDVPPLT